MPMPPATPPETTPPPIVPALTPPAIASSAGVNAATIGATKGAGHIWTAEMAARVPAAMIEVERIVKDSVDVSSTLEGEVA